MVAVLIRCKVGELVDDDMPEWRNPTVGLNAIDVRFHLGDGEGATARFGIELGVDKPPNITVGPAAVLAASKVVHTMDGI